LRLEASFSVCGIRVICTGKPPERTCVPVAASSLCTKPSTPGVYIHRPDGSATGTDVVMPGPLVTKRQMIRPLNASIAYVVPFFAVMNSSRERTMGAASATSLSAVRQRKCSRETVFVDSARSPASLPLRAASWPNVGHSAALPNAVKAAARTMTISMRALMGCHFAALGSTLAGGYSPEETAVLAANTPAWGAGLAQPDDADGWL